MHCVARNRSTAHSGWFRSSANVDGTRSGGTWRPCERPQLYTRHAPTRKLPEAAVCPTTERRRAKLVHAAIARQPRRRRPQPRFVHPVRTDPAERLRVLRVRSFAPRAVPDSTRRRSADDPNWVSDVRRASIESKHDASTASRSRRPPRGRPRTRVRTRKTVARSIRGGRARSGARR